MFFGYGNMSEILFCFIGNCVGALFYSRVRNELNKSLPALGDCAWVNTPVAYSGGVDLKCMY